MGIQNGTASMENSRKVPQKIKNRTSTVYHPAIPLLGISLKVLKSRSGRDISTSMFIATLFTAAKMWK